MANIETYGFIGSILTALGFLTKQQVSHSALKKRMSTLESDVRTCFGTNREQYVNKEVCIVRSSAVEDKVKEISVDTKELQVGLGKMAIQLAEIHAVFCEDKRNKEG